MFFQNSTVQAELLFVNGVIHNKKILQICKILQITKMISFFYMRGDFHKTIAVCISHGSHTKIC